MTEKFVTPNQVRESIGLDPLPEGVGDVKVPTDATENLDLRTFNLVRAEEGLPPLEAIPQVNMTEAQKTVNDIRAELNLEPLPDPEGSQQLMFPDYYRTELMTHLKDFQPRVKREDVYKMLTKENAYAQFWGGPAHDSQWGYMDWITFAEKYINEAKLAWANFTPDKGAIRIRMIKAASLLVSGLSYLGENEDFDRLAGVSSSKFPVLHGGLQTYKELLALVSQPKPEDNAVSPFIPEGSIPEELVDAAHNPSCCGNCKKGLEDVIKR